MDALRQKPPSNVNFHEFDDGSGRAVFAVRWYNHDFANLNDFRAFYTQYSTALQALIQHDSMDAAEEWYSPSPDVTEDQIEALSYPTAEAGDAAIWARSHFDFAPIPWLKDFDHETLYVFHGGEFPELVAEGSEGYLSVFVADTLP